MGIQLKTVVVLALTSVGFLGATALASETEVQYASATEGDKTDDNAHKGKHKKHYDKKKKEKAKKKVEEEKGAEAKKADGDEPASDKTEGEKAEGEETTTP